MASKKRKGGRDDFDWDSDLDFDIPDFGGTNPEVMAKDRKPIATGLKSAAEGFGKSFVNEARLRKTLTKSLPKEYEEPISKAFEIKDGARDLYNIASTQVNETVRETKRSVGRIARNLESAIPKGAYEKIMRWSSSADSDSGSSGPSKDEIEQGTINNAMLEVFADTAKMQADDRKKDQARLIIQDSIDKKRHADMTQILGSIDQSLISIQTRQEQVGTNYMKKSLELQFRTYFIQNDMLQLQSKYFQMFKDDLAAITKNTGLPDYVKKAPKEALMERLREKTFDSLANSLSSKRNKWLGNIFKKAGAAITDKIGQVREGMSQAFDTAEMMASMHSSGMGPSSAEMLGDIAGGVAGSKVQDFAAKYIRKHMIANPKAVKMGNKLGMAFNSLPQWVNKEITSGKYADKVPDWLRDILSQDQESSRVDLNREVDLERAAQFSDKNSRSINIVIPELLSKIQHELYMQRTGDTSSKPLTYDYERGKFITSTERQSSLASSIVTKRTIEHTKHQVDSIFKEIDPTNQLSEEDRRQIAEKIYGANKRGVMFDKEGMAMATDHGQANSMIRQYLDGDNTGGRERRLSKMFGQVGHHNGEYQDLVQHLVNSGRHGELADLGIIDLNDKTINLELLRRMELGEDVFGNQGPTPPSPSTPSSTPTPSAPSGGAPSRRPPRRPNVRQGGFVNLSAVAGHDPQPTPPVSNIGTHPDQLAQAFEKVSGKPELIEIRDILKRIEEKGMGGGGGGTMTPEMFQEFMANRAGGFFGRAGQLFGQGAKGIGGLLGKGARGSWGLSKRAYNWATSGPSMFEWLGKQKDKFDLFIEGEVEPRIKRAKLEGRRYYDMTTKKIIEKFEDIQGDIKDLDTGEIVLRPGDLKNAILKNFETGKSVLVSLTDWGKKSITFGLKKAKELAEGLLGGAKTVYGMGWHGLKKAYAHLTDGPMDVYLKDSYDTPVLLKRVMEKGLYFDKDSLDAITKVSQIKGPVVDNQENVLITKEDLHNGLYDKHGQEIKTGFDKVLQFVGNSIKKTLGTYKRILGKAKDMGSKAMAWLKGLFGFDSPFTVFSQRTNDILTSIYNLLNDRMPGEKSPPLEVGNSLSSSAANGVKAAGEGGRKLFSRFWKKTENARNKAGELYENREELKDKAKQKYKDLRTKAEDLYEHRDEHISRAAEEVNKHTGKHKDKLLETWDKMYKLMDERLPGKKKVAGDSDGDGIRDGSIEDLRTRRQKTKDRLKDAKDAGMSKLKGTSGYAALAELLGKLKKKKDGDKDDSGPSLTDALADGSGGGSDKDEKRKRRLERLRNAKPKGRVARAWDAVKNRTGLGTAATAGAANAAQGAVQGAVGSAAGTAAQGAVAGAAGRGAVARTLLGAGKFFGKTALMTAGSVLTGGLLSAEVMMGGLGLVGSALGMTATALGAIISSPITVPLLAIAAVGTAGYFAYKYLTKPDPQPLEKVRLVQYGFKATNLEAYKKMKTLEQKVSGSVVFKGENAEFDPKRLNLPELMKDFGLDGTNPEHAKKFIDWFANRFRPIYLQHRALIKTIQSPKELENVDDNKPELKKHYLEQCLFPGPHYSVITNPFKDQDVLVSTQGSVEREIENAKVEVLKTDNKTDKEKDKKAQGAATAAAALKAAQEQINKKDAEKEQSKDKKDVKGVPKEFGGDPEKIAAANRLKAATQGALAAQPGMPGSPANNPAGPQGTGKFNNGISIQQPGNGTGGDINAIPLPKGNGNWNALKDTIVTSAKMVGVDPKLAAAITAVESNFDANARPIDKRTGRLFSSAKGLNQFTDDTWNSMMDKYAKKYGIDPSTTAMDPRANALLGAEFLKENTEGLKKYLKRDVTATDVYMAHFMGPGGAHKFLTSDPDALGTAVFPDAAASNPWIYYKDPATMSGPKTLAEIYSDFTQKLSKKLAGSGYSDTDVAGVVADPSKTKEENARLQASQSAPGTVKGGELVASPKPTTPNVMVNNPNLGPTPSSYGGNTTTPAALVASPRPSYDPSNSSAAPAPAALSPRSASQDTYYQKQSKINTGDSIDIMTKSLDEEKAQTGLLTRIADAIDKLPTATAEALAKLVTTAEQAATPAPSEANNYGKTPVPMAKPSIAFKRQLAGQ